MKTLQLAKSYDPAKHSPDGFLVSTKLDGVRAYWDGTRLLTRRGHEIIAPSEFTRHLPPVPLDGEIYPDCPSIVSFDETSGLVRSKTLTAESRELWAELRYAIFDAPEQPGSFAERYAWMLGAISEEGQHYVLPQTECADQEALDRLLEAFVRDGFEGLMLRRADAPYKPGRNADLLKLKKMHDAEAKVIGSESGTGRNADRLGALICRWVDPNAGAATFKVGTGFTDEQREAPPAVGDVITIGYQEITRGGKPRFPVFIRVREDA